jgi:hypothetical protein
MGISGMPGFVRHIVERIQTSGHADLLSEAENIDLDSP